MITVAILFIVGFFIIYNEGYEFVRRKDYIYEYITQKRLWSFKYTIFMDFVIIAGYGKKIANFAINFDQPGSHTVGTIINFVIAVIIVAVPYIISSFAFSKGAKDGINEK